MPADLYVLLHTRLYKLVLKDIRQIILYVREYCAIFWLSHIFIYYKIMSKLISIHMKQILEAGDVLTLNVF